MANVQEIKSEALATIDAALAILQKFPNLNDANVALSYNTSKNPFPFLLECFKNTQGYNKVIQTISKFIMYGIPVMEVTVKGVLLSHIKNILSCSINPFISDELLRNGIVFDLKQIDITDMLRYSPTDKVGQYYYFDNIESVEKSTDIDEETRTVYKTAEQLKNSKDFNCLVWYMANKSVFREVWGKKQDTEDIETDDNLWNATKGKCKKGAGIITLEYSGRSENLKDAEGNGMAVQIPMTDCLHVFLGNVQRRSDTDISAAQHAYAAKAQELVDLNKQIGEITDDLEDLTTIRDSLKEDLKAAKIDKDTFDSESRRIKSNIESTNNVIKSIKDQLKKSGKDKAALIKEMRKLQASSTGNYRPINQNYYYRRTLAEFNVDYVMSLKLFDAKVVTAQLLDALVGILSIDLGFTYKQQLIKDEVQKMVSMIVETDDTEVSDCFFTFTNDDYINMLEKAELNRANLFSINGEESNNIQIDAAQLLESLNSIDSEAIQSGDTSVIEHALMAVNGTITDTKYSLSDSIKFTNPFGSLIDNLLTKLACVLVYAILSPKLYLLILINLQTLGRQTNFSLEQFIGQFKNLIVSLIRSVRDMLLKFLVNELTKILSEIATEITIKIGVEQMEYHMRLMKRLLDCFKRKRRKYDWEMDDINYADIESEETSVSANDEC